MKRLIKETFRIIGTTVVKAIPRQYLRYAQDLFIYRPRMKSLRINGVNTSLFKAVFFEVRTRCNGNCPFCAASIQNETREDREMPFELYKKVIDELKQINYSGSICPFINNEPFIFKDLPKFVSYARKTLPNAQIVIFSNGKALTPSKGEELLKAGINVLYINYYNDDLEAPLPQNLKDFRDIILPKFYGPELNKNGERHALDDDTTIYFRVFRRRVNVTLTSRAGTSPNKKEPSTTLRGFCEYPFTQFNITADGRVSKCCADFYFSDPMGNVKNQSVMEIWYGDKFNNIRNNLLNGNRNAIEDCKNCDYFGCGCEHMSSIGRLIRYLT